VRFFHEQACCQEHEEKPDKGREDRGGFVWWLHVSFLFTKTLVNKQYRAYSDKNPQIPVIFAAFPLWRETRVAGQENAPREWRENQEKRREPGPGIEPGYTDLQSAA
jgi:hypothetical protein